MGIPLSVALASIQLQLPLWVSGAGFWGLAGLLLLTMPEQGYRPVAPAQRHAWQGLRKTWRAGLATVRRRAALRSIFVITVLYGMSSEALSRLAPLHLLATIGLPSFAEATWFGIRRRERCLAVLWSPGASARRRHSNPQRIVQILLAFTVVMLLATLLFALAGVFWLGLIAVWMTRWMRIATTLVVAWANRGLAPGARATVLSMLSQAEALGEVCGGPLLGLVGTLHTVRTAPGGCRHGAAPSATALWPGLAPQQTGGVASP